MWWAGSSQTEVYLGATMLGVRQDGAPSHWESAMGVEGSVDALRSALMARDFHTRRIRVWLSATLARPFLVPADSGAGDQQEAQAVAESIACDATGLRGTPRVWMDLWRSGHGCAAVAVEPQLLNALEVVCAQARCTLRSVRPWWNLALEEDAVAMAAGGESGVLWSVSEPDGITLCLIERGRIVSIDGYGAASHDPQFAHVRLRASLTAGAACMQWHAIASLSDNVSASNLPIGAWSEGIPTTVAVAGPMGRATAIQALR